MKNDKPVVNKKDPESKSWPTVPRTSLRLTKAPLEKHIFADRWSIFMATKVIKFDFSRTVCIKDTPDVIMFLISKVNYMGIPWIADIKP